MILTPGGGMNFFTHYLHLFATLTEVSVFHPSKNTPVQFLTLKFVPRKEKYSRKVDKSSSPELDQAVIYLYFCDYDVVFA